MANLDPNIPLRVVTSYAHADKEYLAKFDKYWKPFRESGVIASWTDREMLGGSLWDVAIQNAFQAADVYIFLVSADSVASDYIKTVELKIALERHLKNEAILVPIILRRCWWTETPLGQLQAYPTDGKPISTWANEDDALFDATDGLRKVLIEAQERKKLAQILSPTQP